MGLILISNLIIYLRIYILIIHIFKFFKILYIKHIIFAKFVILSCLII